MDRNSGFAKAWRAGPHQDASGGAILLDQFHLIKMSAALRAGGISKSLYLHQKSDRSVGEIGMVQ